ncbi:S8 family serine peptidase [Massilia sp. W12]|uniref:S8 family peptidase n=1 Tax=Massilia sp. W12 TaxID=3126507 RepID=UPI0030CAB196
MINRELSIPQPIPPRQFSQPQISLFDAQVDTMVRVRRARNSFQVSGAGLTVAVLDTGLRTTHVDFQGKVRAQKNFTSDNNGNSDDVTDGNGHGTNVGGIIVAKGIHNGIAPGANIAPLKVLANEGGGSFAMIDAALQWVLDNHHTHNISVVSMSLGSSSNDISDDDLRNEDTCKLIQKLSGLHIPVVVAAGNDYFEFKAQGMSYPAILRETISVGAVYDANEGPFEYNDGAIAFSSRADQITPFSQRLHQDVDATRRTDIFAPGAPVTSSGIASDRGESVQQGTSQATPVVSGVILLLQEFFLRNTGRLPSVPDIIDCLRNGGKILVDGDDENDNVPHTGKKFLRLDALSSLEIARRKLQRSLLHQGSALR